MKETTRVSSPLLNVDLRFVLVLFARLSGISPDNFLNYPVDTRTRSQNPNIGRVRIPSTKGFLKEVRSVRASAISNIHHRVAQTAVILKMVKVPNATDCGISWRNKMTRITSQLKITKAREMKRILWKRRCSNADTFDRIASVMTRIVYNNTDGSGIQGIFIATKG
jgi:hypothetical protein